MISTFDLGLSKPIEFVEDNGRVNQTLLKTQIDRRISKIRFLCSFQLKDVCIDKSEVKENFGRLESETQTQNVIEQNQAIPLLSLKFDGKTQSQEQLSQSLNFFNIKKTKSLMATYQNLNKEEFNTERNTIEENPEREASQSSDQEKRQIEISRDSKFFTDSNLQLEHFIKSSQTKQAEGDQNNSSKGGETEDTNTNNIFVNVSMKSSINIPGNDIVTPMKNLLKESNGRSSILKSSVKCAKNLFDNSNKKSHLITSFIDQQYHQKKEVLNSFSKQMKRSYCTGCSNKGSRKICAKSSRKGSERIYVSEFCKENMKTVVREMAEKGRKETNFENKVRQNLLKRICQNSEVSI